MFKRWIEKLVAGYAEKHISALQAQHIEVIKALFKEERANFYAVVAELKADASTHFAELKDSHLSTMGEKAATTIDDEVARFEALLTHSYVPAHKEEPSTWTADSDTVTSDHKLRNPAPWKRRK